MKSSKLLDKNTEYKILELIKKCQELSLDNINFVLNLDRDYYFLDCNGDWRLIAIDEDAEKTYTFKIGEREIVHLSTENIQTNLI